MRSGDVGLPNAQQRRGLSRGTPAFPPDPASREGSRARLDVLSQTHLARPAGHAVAVAPFAEQGQIGAAILVLAEGQM